jgi:hypothetical protein
LKVSQVLEEILLYIGKTVSFCVFSKIQATSSDNIKIIFSLFSCLSISEVNLSKNIKNGFSLIGFHCVLKLNHFFTFSKIFIQPTHSYHIASAIKSSLKVDSLE